MPYQLVPFQPGMEADFYGLHCPANEAGWCHCVAWWVETWDGWSERTAEQNRSLRQSLLVAGQYDGYLLFKDDQPIAWCQVGQRDRLVKLVNQMALEPDPAVWAITCFLVASAFRRQGVAGTMLEMILADLKSREVSVVEAYPRRGPDLDTADMWNGPEQIYLARGFEFVKEAARRSVLRRTL